MVDTGVDTTHPYLAGRSGAGVDGLGDGGACFADDCPGGTTSAVGTASAAPCAATGCDHGTHVAGIAVGDASKVTVSGVAGMAPGAGLYPVRVFSTSTDSSVCGSSVPCATAWEGDVLAGLDHVATEASHYQFAAVNLSLGDSDTHPSVCSGVNVPIETAIGALRDAGIAVVASSGNHGTTASISFPACADGALPVGAVDASNHIAPFSDASPQVPLLMAPGTNILSSLPGGTFGRKSGTSMAAPAVSGAFALLRQAAPTATLASLVDLLRTTGPTVADTRPGATGTTYPILDVNAALATLGFAAPAPVPAPAVNFHGLSTPQRLVDTRAGIGGVRLAAATTLTVAVPGVPSTATSMGAASLNVTAVGAAAPGFLTVYPCGQARPNVSSVNYVATTPVANKVVAAVPADGQVCIFTMSATDVVVDMDGWLPPDQPFHAVTPARVLDTRQTSGLLTDVVVPVAPAGSSGAVVNVTITDSRAAGYATLYPCGEPPARVERRFPGRGHRARRGHGARRQRRGAVRAHVHTGPHHRGRRRVARRRVRTDRAVPFHRHPAGRSARHRHRGAPWPRGGGRHRDDAHRHPADGRRLRHRVPVRPGPAARVERRLRRRPDHRQRGGGHA